MSDKEYDEAQERKEKLNPMPDTDRYCTRCKERLTDENSDSPSCDDYCDICYEDIKSSGD